MRRRLEYLPIGLFGSVMWLAGISIAWQIAHIHFGLPEWASDTFAAAAIIAFVLVSCAYAVKFVSAPDVVRAEFDHPIAGNLFGVVLISLLLLPILIAPVSAVFARCIWAVGAVGIA